MKHAAVVALGAGAVAAAASLAGALPGSGGFPDAVLGPVSLQVLSGEQLDSLRKSSAMRAAGIGAAVAVVLYLVCKK